MKRQRLKRRTALKRSSRLRGSSSKRRASGAAYVAFVLGIKDRDGWRCRYCRTRSGPLDPHHVVKRSQGGGLQDPDNVVTLCRVCHDWTDAAGESSTGRLIVERLGGGRFAFSVEYRSKFTRRAQALPHVRNR